MKKKHQVIHASYLIFGLVVITAGAAATKSLLEIGPQATVTGDFPEIRFIDNDTGDQSWEMEANGDRFQIDQDGQTSEAFAIYSGAASNNLVIADNTGIGINTSVPQSSNELEIVGNTSTFAAVALSPSGPTGPSARMFTNISNLTFGLSSRNTASAYNSPFISSLTAPNSSLTIDAQGDVGINGVTTSAIQENLHVGGGQVFLDASGLTGDWTLNPGSTGLFFRNSGRSPFQVHNEAPTASLVVEDSGNVGVGTSIPDAAFEVFRADGSAQLLVNEASGSVANRTMLTLSNNGGVRFNLENRNTGGNWFVATTAIDRFTISREGTGGPEFTLRADGQISMGGGGDRNFLLEPNGDLEIAGVLTESSNRDMKENFETVDTNDLLKKIESLPITTWNYKTNDDGIRHLGPMAQDFHEIFGLGKNDVTLAPLDTSGVALAAVKGLQEKLSARDERISELEDEVEDLRNMLEERLTALEAQLQK